MINRSLKKLILAVASVVIVLTLCLNAAEAKAIQSRGRITRQALQEPLVAVASGQQQYAAIDQQPPNTEIQYVYANQAPGTAEPQEPEYHQPAGQGVEQQQQQQPAGIQYVQQGEGHQFIQVSAEPQVAHSHDGTNCNQKQDYVSAPSGESKAEYPGEIIYIGQNSEAFNSPNSRQELSNVAGSLTHSSGMQATILTEVPVNEMPPHILNKLKRDYGVKVVATRERPGANLVINCDSNSSQESSICNQQAPSIISTSQPEHSTQTGPYVYSTSSNLDHNHDVATIEHVVEPHHLMNGPAAVEPPTRTIYENVDTGSVESPETRPVEHIEANVSGGLTETNEEHTDDAYGARTRSGVGDQSDSVANSSPNEQDDSSEPQTGKPNEASASPENESQHGSYENSKNFEEQGQPKQSNEGGHFD